MSAPREVSATADWVRAMTRTQAITPMSSRTLAAIVVEHGHRDGTHPALVGEDASLTYGELASRARAYSGWARQLGLRKGDKIALMLAGQPDYIAIWLGLSSIGVVTALIPTALRADGLAHALALVGARHIVVGAEYAEVVAGIVCEATIWVYGADRPDHLRIDTSIHEPGAPAVESETLTLGDPALLIFTSGTTGLPKAAYVSHYRVVMWSEWFAGLTDASPDDRLYDCLPLYHSVGGVVAVGAMLAAGGTVILRQGFSAKRFWADVRESRATIFQYIGELCRYLTAAPAGALAETHALRLCIGNGLRADVWAGFAERFAIPRIIEFYAATEGSFSLFNVEGRPGAIGRIPRFMAHRAPVALVRFDYKQSAPLREADGFCRRCPKGEVGEAIGRIESRAGALATRFEGYTSAVENEAKILRDVFAQGDAWFRTGDLMRQDDAGFYYFVDRIGDTFRWKGENVATSEVEAALAAFPGVQQAAVYGVAVPGADGRAGMAAIVPGPCLDLRGLHAHLVARLPAYARPVLLRLCDEMAGTETFKVRKHDLMQEGFHPASIADALLIEDAPARTYVPLDATRHAAIVSGLARL